MKGFATIARPLINLTKKGKDFIWSMECEQAFCALKKALISPDVMGYPLNKGGLFILDTDACGVGIGSVLAQEQQGRERVISYASRGLNKAERNYCITEKELLAVVFVIQYFRQYLLGRRFLVRTDHQALVWLFSLKEPNGKIARWIEILAPYDFAIEYRPGRKQPHCDALSRCAQPRDCQCSEVDISEALKCRSCGKCRKRVEQMVFGNTSEKDYDFGAKSEGRKATLRIRGATADEEPSTSKSASYDEVQPWLKKFTPEMISEKQRADPDIAPIIQALEREERPTSADMERESPATRQYWISFHQK